MGIRKGGSVENTFAKYIQTLITPWGDAFSLDNAVFMPKICVFSFLEYFLFMAKQFKSRQLTCLNLVCPIQVGILWIIVCCEYPVFNYKHIMDRSPADSRRKLQFHFSCPVLIIANDFSFTKRGCRLFGLATVWNHNIKGTVRWLTDRKAKYLHIFFPRHHSFISKGSPQKMENLNHFIVTYRGRRKQVTWHRL